MIAKEQLFLIPKQIVEDSIRFRIPTGLTRKNDNFGDGYCSWEELLKVKGPLPTDIVIGISWDDDESDEDGGDILVLIVNRSREETDEEYLKRLVEREEMKKNYEKREYHDYVRLKAKYENNETD